MKLSDTQLVVLNTACQRADRRVLPLPSNLKGGAAEKVVASLIAKGLVEETPAELSDPVWRTAEDDQRLALVITRLAFEVLGIEPEEALGAATGAAWRLRQRRARLAPPGKKGRRCPPCGAGGEDPCGNEAGGADRYAAFVGRRHHREIMSATGWLSHTVRGAFAGALKKKLGLTVTSEKIDGRGRVYQIRG